MSFYSDLLRAVNDRVGYNADDPERADNNVDSKFSFSAKPKKHIGLDMSRTVECKDGADGSCLTVEKTASKLKLDHGDCVTTWAFANDKMSMDAKGKAYNEDGWKSNVGGAYEIKQAKSEWKATGSFDVKTPDMGGVKAAINATVEHNNKSETTVKPKINLEVNDEVNLGFSGVWDTKTLKEQWTQAVYKPQDNKDQMFFLRADLVRKFVSAGCDIRVKDGIQHSFEAVFGYGEFKGIQGHPVAIRAGVEYELSDQTEVSASANWDATYSVNQTVQHKIDSHWTVSATQAFEGANVGSKTSPYHIGFAAAYKL